MFAPTRCPVCFGQLYTLSHLEAHQPESVKRVAFVLTKNVVPWFDDDAWFVASGETRSGVRDPTLVFRTIAQTIDRVTTGHSRRGAPLLASRQPGCTVTVAVRAARGSRENTFCPARLKRTE